MLLAVLALSASACSSSVPIRVSGTVPSNLPEFAGPCLENGIGCRAAATAAVRQGDGRLAGQLLVIDAQQRGDDSVTAGRAGLWIAPGAYAPAELAPRLKSSGDMPAGINAGEVPRALVFGNASSPVDAAQVDLELPENDRGTYAVLLGAATKHNVVAWTQKGQTRVAPAAPLLTQLASGPLAVTDGWKTAQKLALAEAALEAGHVSTAWTLMGEAIELLPEATAGPDRAALHFVRYHLAPHAAADIEDSFDGIREACDGNDGYGCAFYERVSLLHQQRGWDPGTLPVNWKSEAGRTAWAADARELAGQLDGDRAALLRALIDEMLLGTSEPTGICDTDHPERVKAGYVPILNVVRLQGRDDLLAATAVTPLGDADTVREADVKALLAWVDAPGRRWLKTRTLGQGLTAAGLTARRTELQHRLAPMCDAYFAAVREDMEADTLADSEDRLLERLLTAVGTTTGCPDRAPATELTDYVLARALEADAGGAAVLALVGQAGFDLIATALTGGSVPDVMASAVMLRDGLAKVQGQLGDSQSDVNLQAVVAVAIGVVDTLTGRGGDLAQTLRDAALALDPGDVDPATLKDAPALVKYQPGLHIGALSLLGLSYLLQGDEASLNKVLAALDRNYERDLKALLVAIDEEDHADAVVRLAGGLVSVGIGLSSEVPNLKVVFTGAEEAATPGEGETGGWAVGLELGRVIVWDLAAFVGSSDRQWVERAAAGADASLTRLANRALKDFELEGTSWEMLHTLPALHRAVFSWITQSEEGPAAFKVAAPGIQSALQDALGKLPDDIRKAGPDELGLMGVVIDMMEVTVEVGVANLDGDSALGTIGEALSARTATWPARYRALGDGIAATVLLEGGKPLLARDKFETASDAAKSYGGKEAKWVPRLLEARALNKAGMGKPADKVVGELLTAADEALACDVVHPGQSLLLYRAWTLEKAGKHAEADAAIARYLGFIEERAYPGDGLLRCVAASNRRHFTLNANVSQRIGQMFMPTNSDGTFEVGAGLKSSVTEGDVLDCSIVPLPAARIDLILSAQLMRAAYAMRAGDQETASQALDGAVQAGNLTLYGSPGAVDPAVAGGLAKARAEQVPVTLILWVSQLARGHGHLGAAEALDAYARQLATERGTSPAAMGAEKEVPAQLAGLGLDGLGPIVAAWWSPADAKTFAAAVRGAPVPQWSVGVYSVERLRIQGDAAGALKAAARLKAPKKGAGAHVVAKLKMSLTAGAGPADLTKAKNLVKALLDAGYPTEAASLMSALVAATKQQGGDVMPLMNTSFFILPTKGGAVLPQMEMLVAALPAMEAGGHLDLWAKRMVLFLPQVSGRIALATEYEVLRITLQILPNVPGGAELMAPASRIFVNILRAQAGSDNPETISWSVVDLAARAVVGDLDKDRIESVQYRVIRHPELDPRFRRFLEQLVKLQDSPTASSDLATQFIESLTR